MSARRKPIPESEDRDLAILVTAADANELLIVGAGYEAARRKRPLTACPDYGGNTRWQELWRGGHKAWGRRGGQTK